MKPTVKVVPCPQQANGYDCGVYAVAFTRFFCQQLQDLYSSGCGGGTGASGGAAAVAVAGKPSLAAAVTVASITALRKEFKDLVAQMLQSKTE